MYVKKKKRVRTNKKHIYTHAYICLCCEWSRTSSIDLESFLRASSEHLSSCAALYEYGKWPILHSFFFSFFFLFFIHTSINHLIILSKFIMMFQEKICHIIHHHHLLDQLLQPLHHLLFRQKMLQLIMIHFSQHLIKIHLQVIFLQLVYHIHFIPMQQHHLILQVTQAYLCQQTDQPINTNNSSTTPITNSWYQPPHCSDPRFASKVLFYSWK